MTLIHNDTHQNKWLNLSGLSKKVDNMSNTVQKLRKTTATHEQLFHKQHKNIEQRIITFIRTTYNFTPLYSSMNLETDILMISECRRIVLIGEVKHHLTPLAFGQVAKRIKEFKMKQATHPSEDLQDVTSIVPLVGAEIINHRERTKAKDLGFVLIGPSGTLYMALENEHNLQ